MKRLLCVVVALFCATGPVRAGDKPNSLLSSQEIADGWILLFDGESTFGWKVEGGEAKVKDGVLVLGGEKATTATFTTAFGSCRLAFEHAAWRHADKAKVSLFHRNGGGTVLIQPEKVQKDWAARSAEVGGVFSPVTVRVEVPAGARLSLRNIKLRPLGLKQVFNGKDLTGWKEFPGRKSKFSVTKEGWLNVKNGNGDLQTVDKWADFTLQLECISNGDFLNSGIFFRCQPDKYQQGYEAQIHNKFNKEADKTYVLEDFDPKTHELIGKRKEKYQAVDYGTGAIYRRIPARKQMSKDREWFTMTVIAAGRHMAVWVNGVQVTDWTDNRPANDNGRNGYRAEAGPISIQGHDPTTDLSFRNIRIAELPKAK